MSLSVGGARRAHSDQPAARLGSMSRRARGWLIAGCVGCLVAIYIVVWAVYAATHMVPRYQQLAPGAAATYESVHYRVLSMTTTEMLASTDEAKPADAGTIWVVAKVEVTAPDPEDYPGCSLDLIGAGERIWPTASWTVSRAAPTYCDSDEMKPDVPYAYEAIYSIPEQYADSLYGLVVKNSLTAAPSEVIRPPV